MNKNNIILIFLYLIWLTLSQFKSGQSNKLDFYRIKVKLFNKTHVSFTLRKNITNNFFSLLFLIIFLYMIPNV